MFPNLLFTPRPRKLTLKGYRQYWVVFKETTLSYYKSQDEAPGDPVQQLNLKGELARQGTPVGWATKCSHPAWFLLGTREDVLCPEVAVGAGFSMGASQAGLPL
jgi:hypothetical protein